MSNYRSSGRDWQDRKTVKIVVIALAAALLVGLGLKLLGLEQGRWLSIFPSALLVILGYVLNLVVRGIY